MFILVIIGGLLLKGAIENKVGIIIITNHSIGQKRSSLGLI